jgi:predicted SprT family Zn-dependent metalloprotease
MELTQPKLFELMTKAEEIVDSLGYVTPKYSYTVDQQKRAAGTCNFTRKRISISSEVAKYHSEEKILNTCVHELLHALAWENFGCSGHTGVWKQLARKINNIYHMNIRRTYKATETQTQARIKNAKYIITCTKCGQIITRSRSCKLTNHLNLFRCKCGGNFKIQKNY